MKRIFIVMLAAICFSGCLKIIDWVPVTFEIMVQDEQGNDLLDPENDNTWLLGTTVWFRGIEVELEKKGISEPVTKDYGIKYEGFRLEKGDNCYYLAFGQFEGATNYNAEHIIICWPDHTLNTIKYNREINNRKGGAKESWKLDGVECTNPIIIVKEVNN